MLSGQGVGRRERARRGARLLDAGQGGLGRQQGQHDVSAEHVEVVVLQVGAHGQALQAQQRRHGQPHTALRLGAGAQEQQPLLLRVRACIIDTPKRVRGLLPAGLKDCMPACGAVG